MIAIQGLQATHTTALAGLAHAATPNDISQPDDGMTAGERDDAQLIVAGRVEEILPALSLRLDGGAEPVRRGRLIFAD